MTYEAIKEFRFGNITYLPGDTVPTASDRQVLLGLVKIVKNENADATGELQLLHDDSSSVVIEQEPEPAQEQEPVVEPEQEPEPVVEPEQEPEPVVEQEPEPEPKVKSRSKRK